MEKPTRPEKPGKTKTSHPCEGATKALQAAKPGSILDPAAEVDPEYYLGFTLALVRDAFNSLPSYRLADFRRDCTTLSRRMSSEGLTFVTSTLPSFFEQVLQHLEGGESDYPSFKKQKGAPYPQLFRGLVAQIYEEPDNDDTVKYVKHLYSICVAFKKLRGQYKKEVLRKQLADFVQTDIEIGHVDLSVDGVRDVAREARNELGRIFKGCDPLDPKQAQDFIPRPGPGATNTPTQKCDRFHPNTLYFQIAKCYDYEEWYRPPFSPPRIGLDSSSLKGDAIEQCHEAFGDNETSHSHYALQRWARSPRYLNVAIADIQRARLAFVHKTHGKARLICIEELEAGYFQQSLRRGLYDWVEHHPRTKGRIFFTSQLENALAALVASIDRKLSTDDMSEASDRVAKHVIQYLWSLTGNILKCIEAVSSTEIQIPQAVDSRFIDYMPIKKLAPMGSAICFPVMACTLYAIIYATIIVKKHPRRFIRDIRIFGDDIIVPTDCVEDVNLMLEAFGFKVNRTKSFSKSFFRESCGTHAYKGVDITPPRVKTLLGKNSQPADLLTCLELEYLLFSKGYKHAAGYLRKHIREWAECNGIKDVPYVHPKSPLIGFRRPDARLAHLHAPTRWSEPRRQGDAAYQSREHKVWVIRERSRTLAPPSGEDGYLRWLTTKAVTDEARFVDDSSPRQFMLVRRWLLESSLGYRC